MKEGLLNATALVWWEPEQAKMAAKPPIFASKKTNRNAFLLAFQENFILWCDLVRYSVQKEARLDLQYYNLGCAH